MRAKLGRELRDDVSDGSSGNGLAYLAVGAGALAVLWIVGVFYTANTTIKAAPKLIPFL